MKYLRTYVHNMYLHVLVRLISVRPVLIAFCGVSSGTCTHRDCSMPWMKTVHFVSLEFVMGFTCVMEGSRFQISLFSLINRLLNLIVLSLGSRISTVSTEPGYRLDHQGVSVQTPVRARIFSPPSCPDQLGGPPSLLSNRYRRVFPRG
jgi:hypothetical protein